MIHIVFNGSEVGLMQNVMALDETLAGEVIQIKDDFAVGPLEAIDTEEGWQARGQWWRQISLNTTGETQPPFDDRETVAAISATLRENPDTVLWIWMAQNQHDVCGYYWLVSRLREFEGRVMVLYLNNLPFINAKGQLFYPNWLHEIQPSEFLKAKKLARPVTLSEFEIDPDEWSRLMQENAPVRILEGGKKIVGKEAGFYDAEILKHITGDWQKASRVVSNTLHKMKIKTGDVFLMWRIRELIHSGKLAAEGPVEKEGRNFEIRKGAAAAGDSDLQETKASI